MRRYAEAGSLLSETRRSLRYYGFRVRKGLGQHFLIDEAVLGVIINTAELTPADVVIEVGPGLGILTGKLAGRAGRVVAIELDSRLVAILEKVLASADNVTVINENVLKIDPAALLSEMGLPPAIDGCSGYKVVANLPYYISSHVLRRFLEASLKPRIMVVMVQKEVAEAIVARPGQMSVLSVSVQFYGEPKMVGYVPARCFYPVPEVDSALLRIDVYPRPLVAVADEAGFFELVRAGFVATRKQIINSLAQGLGRPKSDVWALLDTAGIMPQRRAETMTLDEWARLWQVFTEKC